MTFARFLVVRRDAQFIPILFWGMYVSLLLFVTSDRWIWELNEDYPVQPVAEMIRSHTPTGQIVYTSHPYNRPSLNFYSDRQVVVANSIELQQYWQHWDVPVYFLVQPSPELKFEDGRILGETSGWQLITRHGRKV
ncbi:hypothetical protein IQ235_17605 [Oscillatoriales cyanobacterium LEGE 11467]|uniref:Uncharacterized protein n=1 Tax=Zarconia navalis LEGE 11467 TaxID=1828826 RepID=A0A928W139_9CYAN|nr:hypothetical protein [Zarconia navalis LEGE 11467]